MKRTLISVGLALAIGLTGCAADYATSVPDQSTAPGGDPGGANTNVNFGGAQDFGYFRSLLSSGVVPRSTDLDEAGFFAEHHTPLPEPNCGDRICLQAMLGVMNNLVDGEPTTMLQLGLNSPVAIDPETRPRLNIAVVVDVSCSMASDGKINYVRSGLLQMVEKLRDDDRIALITYSTNANMLLGLARVEGRRDQLRGMISRLSPQSATNIWAGLEMGYDEVQRHFDPQGQNRVIMLSDGMPSAGITNPAQILGLSAARNQEGIGLTTIGLGRGFSLELMSGLAEQGDGNFYFVENVGAVEEVFTQEVDFFTVPVAFDLEIDVYAGRDFTIGAAHGSSRFSYDTNAGRLEIPSVFLAHRTAHDDVTPEDGRRGGGSALLIELDPTRVNARGNETQVAKIEMRYRLPDPGGHVSAFVPVMYPFSPDEVVPGGYFDHPIVTKSFVMMNIVTGLRTASDLFHAGDGTEAIGVLLRLTAAVQDYQEDLNEGRGDVDMQLDIELIKTLVRVMETRGAVPPSDPMIPADPWPGD